MLPPGPKPGVAPAARCRRLPSRVCGRRFPRLVCPAQVAGCRRLRSGLQQIVQQPEPRPHCQRDRRGAEGGRGCRTPVRESASAPPECRRAWCRAGLVRPRRPPPAPPARPRLRHGRRGLDRSGTQVRELGHRGAPAEAAGCPGSMLRALAITRLSARYLLAILATGVHRNAGLRAPHAINDTLRGFVSGLRCARILAPYAGQEARSCAEVCHPRRMPRHPYPARGRVA